MSNVTEKEVIAVTHDWYGIELTEEQAREAMSDPGIKSNLAWGLDTVARESIGAWLGRKIVGRPWPIYGDGPDAAEAYWRELADKAPAAGYKLTEDRT